MSLLGRLLTEDFARRLPGVGGRIVIGYMKISKRTFYLNGGFANSRCVRVTRGRSWAYFWRVNA